MIHIDKLKAVKTVVSHANCPDGVASAWILRDALPSAEILFMQYGTPDLAALPATDGMCFVDFSPPPERAPEFVAVGAICLDHHKTARAVVESFGELGVFADETAEPGVCGAVLAYREVWQPVIGSYGSRVTDHHIYELAALAGVRDTWQRHDLRWDAACAQAEALRFWPVDTLLGWSWETLYERLAIGPVLIQKHNQRVDSALATAFRFVTAAGTRVIVFQGVEATSDGAEKLGSEADLVMGFKYEFDGSARVIFSCRSRGTFDASALAKRYGGGGHTKAAGFSYPVKTLGQGADFNPYSHAVDLVKAFEAEGGA